MSVAAIVHLPDEDAAHLNEMAKQTGRSLTELLTSIIRELVADDRRAEGRVA
jgi:hypothetical protein